MPGFISRLKKAARDPFSLCLFISVLALAVGGYNTYLLSTARPASGFALAPTQSAKEMSEREVKKLVNAGAPVLGNPEAEVAVVEFADFQCPYCGRYHKDVYPELERFIDAGQVKFIYVDFAILGEESLQAAMAARCAKEQGRFWEYHDYLYEHQQGENRGAFAPEKLKGFARALGFDQAFFDQCLDTGKYERAVRESTALGQSFGVKGTPATFINDFFIPGLQGASYFVNRVETALK